MVNWGAEGGLGPTRVSPPPLKKPRGVLTPRYGWSDYRGQVTSAVVLLHRKMTIERAEPISTMKRMFIFLANAMTTAIPNKTLIGSQGTATANRIVI
jgi:hypothetical protein